jgi:hypothetical protein
MISENIIKTKFIVDTLKHQTDIYYKRELERFHQYLKSDSGSTLKSLTAPDYTIVASGENFQLFTMSKIQILKAIHNKQGACFNTDCRSASF